MKIETAFFSHTGSHGDNEDAVLPPTYADGQLWAAIADGVGGHEGGRCASNTAVETLKSLIEREPTVEMMVIFATVRERLETLAKSNDALGKMGTTLSALRLSGPEAAVGHVGDSRIYHLRGDGIVGRTSDQTEVQRLIDDRILSRAQARRYPRRRVLLSVLSPTKKYDLQQKKFQIQEGDRIILVTDGVHEKILRQEMRDLSLLCSSADEFCHKLEREVARREPIDDYSAICIDLKA